LAIPAAMAIAGLILDDTYANRGRRSALNLARGPVLGLVMALASQGLLWIGNPDLALPRWITFYGCGMSLLLSSAFRMLFPPVSEQFLSATTPALWLKQAGGSRGRPKGIVSVLKVVSGVAAIAAIGIWIAERSGPPRAGIVMALMLLVVVYQILTRA
jgi:hypothetical protein